MLNLKFWRVAMVLAIFGLALDQAGFSQIPDNVSAKGINLPYFEGTQIKAFFIAEAADPAPGGHIQAKGFQMYTFGPTGTNDIEVIIKAPECLFDYDDRRAWSAGRLQAFNSSTNYVIEGEGFVCQRTKGGSTLEISNNVHTVIRREDQSTRKLLPPIHIYSDHFRFLSEEAEGPDKRIANYNGNVRVDDPAMLLNCGSLRVAIPAGTNQVRTIIARENVRIRSKADHSQATGEYAFYSSNPTNEVVTLSGKPVWRDAQNEGRAEQFIFDRKRNIVFALTNAQLKMPRNTVASAELISTDSKKTTPATNGFITVNAEFFEIALPMTNRPSRSLIARTNVVILSPADRMKATANTAMVDDATGILHLRGNAVWHNDQKVARGDVLTLNRTNRTFRAERNASLRLPSNKNTNQFLQITSANYLLKTNVANFEGGVRAEFIDGKAPRLLTCNTLEILMRSNEVETILARGDVRMTQTMTNGQSRSLFCEDMTIQRSLQTGNIKSLLAEREVSLIEKDSKSERKLAARIVTMNFGLTNQLESMLAEQDVRISQGESWATGERAVYVATKEFEIFEITGNPVGREAKVDPDGIVRGQEIHEAAALRWNPKTGFSTEGGVIQAFEEAPPKK